LPQTAQLIALLLIVMLNVMTEVCMSAGFVEKQKKGGKGVGYWEALAGGSSVE